MEEKFIDNIILTSDEPWCEIWHTQLHYAFQLSQRTNVIFLGPPAPWKFSNLFTFRQVINRISETLVVVQYHNLIPAGFGKLSLWINDHLNTWLMKKNILPPLKSKRGIVWHFDPHRSFYIFQNNTSWRHLFHVIDPIAGCNLDVQLAKMADIVVVTSPKFIDHYRSINNKVIQIGQGVDVDFYKEQFAAENINTDVSSDSIMLLGTITDQIHFSLLKRISQQFPSKLVLIGPDKIQSEKGRKMFNELLQSEGVQWLGPMPPADFRHHLRACRVGIIAYDNSINYKNDFRSPLKVISYLACGKNIISNTDCEVPSLVNKAIYNVTGDDEYFDLIRKCYSNELFFDEKAVNEFLHSIDYNNLLNIIFTHLGEQLPPAR